VCPAPGALTLTCVSAQLPHPRRWVFWLSCAGALSADLNNYGRALDGSSKSRMQAAVAFSWLTWWVLVQYGVAKWLRVGSSKGAHAGGGGLQLADLVGALDRVTLAAEGCCARCAAGSYCKQLQLAG